MSFKDLGNEEYKKGNWLKAAAMYTKGIKEEPENAVLYRYNRQSRRISPRKMKTSIFSDTEHHCIL